MVVGQGSSGANRGNHLSGSSEIDTPGDENGATEKLKGKKNKKGKQTKSKNQ